ncbi:hypothetical protein D3C76_446470 [compost metagenome]
MTPAIAITQLQQVAQRQQARGSVRQLAVQPLAALLQRGFQAVEAAGIRLGKALQLAALHQAFEPIGAGQMLHTVILGNRERSAHAIEEHHAGDATGHGREQRRHAAAHAVGEHMELRQAQAVGHRQHVLGMFPEVIAAVVAAMRGTAVADQVRRYDEASVEHRRQTLERCGIVQPTVQRQHRNAVFRAPGAHSDFHAVEVKQVILGTAQRTHRDSPWLKTGTLARRNASPGSCLARRHRVNGKAVPCRSSPSPRSQGAAAP